MKILHALASYLAATLAALPFHPFAFAHPLPVATIDYYDGYVPVNRIDGPIMKYFLGSIVDSESETCQAVPQNHSDSDSALMKRIPGDITLKARQTEVLVLAVPVISIVAEIIFSAVWIANDDPVRGNDALADFFVEHLN